MQNRFDNLHIKSKITLGNTIAIVLLIIFAAIVYVNTNTLLVTSHWVEHTEATIAAGHGLAEELLNMETGKRGFLITGDAEFLEPYEKGKSNFFSKLKDARELISDNPDQRKTLEKIEMLAIKWLKEVGGPQITIKMKAGQNSAEEKYLIELVKDKKGKNIIDELRSYLEEFISHEEGLLKERKKENETSAHKTIAFIFFGTLFSIFIIVLSGQRIADSIVVPIILLKKAVSQIGEGDFDVRTEVRGSEELRALSKGINIMAENLQKSRDDLIAAQKQAESASNTKSQFLANMSHEIRTPMMSILGMAELLAESKLEEEQATYVEHLTKAGDALIRIINDILDLSKVESGLVELEIINFYLDEEIEKIISIFGGKLAHKDLKLKKDISTCVDYYYGDPIRLRQVLINLVGNAIKFTESGEVEISARCSGGSCCHEACNILFSVRDTGVGIPNDKLDTIFESFSQGDTSTTRIYGGTGLGLSISRKLVELMGGQLEVESNVGQGSRFFFTLNMKKGSPEIEYPVEAALPLAPGRERALRILMAEDSEDNRNILKSFLKETPHTLDEVENGEAAIEMFTANAYDLVLMDMQMPVIDGYTATRIIRGWEERNEKKAIPIIAITAHAMKEEVQRCLDAGCSAHLAKPIKKKILLEAIRSYAV